MTDTPTAHPAQRVAATLVRAEAAMHRRGWEHGPMLYAVYQLDDGSEDNTATWAGQPELLVVGDTQMLSMVPDAELWSLYGDPFALLAGLNDGFGGGPGTAMHGFLTVLAEPGFAGVLYAGEADMVASRTNLREHYKGRLADHPDRIEIRFLFFQGADGCSYLGIRERPTDKVTMLWRHPDGTTNESDAAGGLTPNQFDKRVPDVMRDLVNHIRRQLGQEPLPEQ